MAAAMSKRSSWPSGPTRGSHTDDYAQDQVLPGQGPTQAVIGEMTGLLRDTRGNMLMAGGMLGATIVGIALEAAVSARVLRLGLVGVLNVGLLCSLLLCWLRAVTLLALAGRPVLSAHSGLRRETGAPLDPRAGWLTLPSLGANLEEWTDLDPYASLAGRSTPGPVPYAAR